MRYRCQHLVALIASGWLMILLAPPSLGAARAHAELFHTKQIYFADLDPFTKWNAVVARTERQRADARKLCPAGDKEDCVLARWRRFVAVLRGLPILDRVTVANSVLNRVPYVPAIVNWRDPDHWETPFEFLQYGGQCEDFAIAKLAALSESGIDERDLRLVVVWDRTKRLAHAVAVVFVAGQALVLDNQIHEVTPDTEITRYVPFYAINRLGWWRPAIAARAAMALR